MPYLIFGVLGTFARALVGSMVAVAGFLMLGLWMDVSSNLGVEIAASVVALVTFVGLIFGLSFAFKFRR